MKRFLICCVAIAAAFFTACTSDEVSVFGDVYGTITDSKSGEPVQNAEIILSPGNRTTISGSDGHFEFKSLEAGQYKISVTANDYAPNSRQVTIVPGNSVICDIHLSQKSISEIIKLSTTNINFGSTQTQLSLTITNNGNTEAAWDLNLGNNPWLTASPIAGRIASGHTEAIVFTANRASLVEETSGVISISALNNTIPITVSCSPSKQVSSIMEVEPLDLDFGTQSTEQIIRIKNKSNANLNWTIYQIEEKALSVSDTSGTIQPGNAKVVAVKLDRSQVTSDIVTSFMVSDGTNDQPINVIIKTNPEEVTEKVGKMTLSTNVLNFGDTSDVQTFKINNEGEAGFDWQIADIQHPEVIKCTPLSGSVSASGSAEIKVEIDRSKWDSDTFESSFYVTDGVNKYGVAVIATQPKGEIELSEKTLNFEDTRDSLGMTITNIGVGVLNWEVAEIKTPDIVKVTPYAGLLNSGEIVDISVTIDRELIEDDKFESSFTITDGENNYEILIVVAKAKGEIELSSTSLNFDGASDTQSLTITNIGRGTLNWEITDIKTPDAIKVTPDKGTLKSKEATDISVVFSRETVTDEMFESSFTITDGENKHTVVITAIEPSKIFYTTTDGNIITVDESVFDAEILSNTYENGQGVITFNGKLTTVGTHAISYRETLKTITLPDGLISIGDEVFSGCTNLISVGIPKSVATIGKSTFYNCSGLLSITLPAGVTSIGENAFCGCASITSIVIPSGVTEIKASTFIGCSNLTTVNLPDGVTSIGDAAFSRCSNLSSINVPNTVTYIGGTAFDSCGSLTSINIPKGVTSIKDRTFYSCQNLVTVTIPEGVTSIGNEAFWCCSGLQPVELPQSLTTIGQGAFSLCGSLTSITIPEGVTLIGREAFSRNNKLTLVYCKPTTPPTLGPNVFSEVPTNCAIYVPDGTYDAYIAADGWVNYKHLIVSPVQSQILYTSTDGKVVNPNNANAFGAAILSNTYENGQGVISINGTITSIGEQAFENCSNLASMVIPKGITSIGRSAFYGCRNLTSITLPQGVTSIGKWVFNGCSNLTSIDIPEGVTSIGEGAFNGCKSLKSIAIPEGVTSIGNHAFYECKNLTSVSILEGVTSIGEMTFSFCEGLTSITIPESVTSIGKNAFQCCSSLASITIPKGVTSVGERAFALCGNLMRVDCLPTTPPTLETDAFGGVPTNCAIYVPDGTYDAYIAADGWVNYKHLIVNPVQSKILYTSTDGKIVNPNNVDAFDAKILSNTYENGQGVITFNGELTTLKAGAFHNCRTLKSITIPESVISIENEVFPGCSGLKSVDIPEGVTLIGNGAFHDCSNLASITLPKSVTTIGDGAFCGCGSLTSLVIPEGVTSIEASTFLGCVSLISMEIPEGVTSIGGSAFKRCDDLRSITIPSSVTYIGVSAFEDCGSLKSITVPTGVTSIEDRTFYACGSLTSATIPEGVTSIGNDAFWVCYSLQTIELPQSLTSIGQSSFSNCSGMTSIVIPAGVTSIGRQAFNGCSSLITVNCKPSTPPTLGSNVFNGVPSNCAIYVPDGTYNTYINNDGWETYKDMIVNPVQSQIVYTTTDGKLLNIDNNVFDANILSHTYENGKGVITFNGTLTKIGNGAFNNCSVLASITIPEGVTSIGEWAFSQCVNLTSVNLPNGLESIALRAFNLCKSLSTVTLPEGVKSIGEGAFSNCENLKSITIPEGVTSIGVSAFYACGNLTSIVIPEGVSSIEKSTFEGCTNLTSATIPESVTSIGVNAFQYCKNLKSVTIPEGVTSIAENAFYQCESLSSITIPQGVTSIGQSAFGNCSSLTSVTIPESVTSIGDGAFSRCTGLTSINIPAGITTINDSTFRECKNLTSVTLPEGLTTIEIDAFNSCSGLTSINIPANVTSIGDGAFWGCSSLASINFNPTTPPTVGANVFNGVPSNCEISVPDNAYNSYVEADSWANYKDAIVNPVQTQILYTTTDGNVVNVKTGTGTFGGKILSNTYENGQGVITVNGKVTTIGSIAFAECGNLASVIIPQGVTSIDDSAFSSCGSLSSISIPESVTSIGSGVFYQCSSLTSITIPANVTSIGSSVLARCNSLTSVYINPTTPPTLGDNLFWEVPANYVIYVPEGSYEAYIAADEWVNHKDMIDSPVKSVMYYTSTDGQTVNFNTSAFDKRILSNTYDNGQGVVTFNGVPTKIVGRICGNGDDKLVSITIPESITSIGAEAFYSCSGLTSVNLPAGITSIEEKTFWKCSSLKSINIPQSVTSIGAYAFASCNNLSSINIPEGVTSINNGTFQYCGNLVSISIPTSVTSIGEGVFRSCGSLASIDCKPKTPPTLGESVFWGVPTTCNIYVPDEAYEAYITANEWSNYKDLIVNPAQILYTTTDGNIVNPYGDNPFGAKIVSNTYENGQGVITVRGEVLNVGDEAFNGCSNLASIAIPEGVTSIGTNAFYGCSNLASISLPVGITKIGSYAFRECKALTSIVLPEGITSIGERAFQACDNLASITIPDSVTSIGKNAFVGCNSLTTITLPAGVTNIGESAFAGCYGLTSINIHNNVTSIGKEAFYSCSKLASITIPESVTSINQSAFWSCTSLTSINIPKSVAYIADWAFRHCTGLTSITIPNGVSFGRGVFYECSGLTSVTISEGVTSIANSMFAYCVGLTTITIPESVTSISQYAFENCSNLTSVYCKPTSVPTLGKEVFEGRNSDLKIYVPTTSLSNYQSATNWKDIKTNIVGYDFTAEE